MSIPKIRQDFLLEISRIPHTDELTQGCGVGLADVKLSPFIDITLFDTET